MNDTDHAHTAFRFVLSRFNNVEEYSVLTEKELPDSNALITGVIPRDRTAVRQR